MSFSIHERSDALQPFPELNAPLFREKRAEIQNLRERVSTATGNFPHQFKEFVEGICHTNFKITVQDASPLRSIQKVALQLSTKSEKVFWETIASQLDLLIQRKAALSIEDFPFDILFEIASYLSLSDLSRFIQGTCVKVTSSPLVSKQQPTFSPINAKKKSRFYSVIKDMLASYPSLIVRAKPDNLELKAQIFQKLSREWYDNQNHGALTRMFEILHHSRNQELRQHYLAGLRHSKIFAAFLDSKAILHNFSLMLDITFSSFSSESKNTTLLYPLVPFNSQHLVYWNQFIQAHLHIQSLMLKTKLNDDLTAYKRKKLLFDIINQLKNVTHLELQYENLAQSLPVFYPSQLGVYREFIQKFSALQTLRINCKEALRLPISLRADAYRKFSIVSGNIQKLLHPDLPIQSLILDIDCFPNTSIIALEKYHHDTGKVYPVHYLNFLLPVIEMALQMKNITEIQIAVPKPSVLRTIEDMTPGLSIGVQPLLKHMHMNVSKDKLSFTFQKGT